MSYTSENTILNILTGKNTGEEARINELIDITTKYPAFGAAKYLLAKQVAKHGGGGFEKYAQDAVLYFPDPFWFHFKLNEEKFMQDETLLQKKEPLKTDGDEDEKSDEIKNEPAPSAPAGETPGEIIAGETTEQQSEEAIVNGQQAEIPLENLQGAIAADNAGAHYAPQAAQPATVESKHVVEGITGQPGAVSITSPVQEEISEENAVPVIEIAAPVIDKDGAAAQAVPDEQVATLPEPTKENEVTKPAPGQPPLLAEIEEEAATLQVEEAGTKVDAVTTPGIVPREVIAVAGDLPEEEIKEQQPAAGTIDEAPETTTIPALETWPAAAEHVTGRIHFVFDETAEDEGDDSAEDAGTEPETPLPSMENQRITAVLQEQLAGFRKPVLESTAVPVETEPYHTIDYFASQGIKLTAEQQTQDHFSVKVKKFTDWLKQMKRIAPVPTELEVDEAAERKVKVIAAGSNEPKEVVTETMAEVLAKQGMAEKAIEVYEKLSFLYPSKSAYFASQIEQLKEH